MAVNDQASSISDTATITATRPIKIRLPGVPINHIVASWLSALLNKRLHASLISVRIWIKPSSR